MYLLSTFIVLTLLFIALQDFKFRAVYWWLFLLLPIALGTIKVLTAGWQLMFSDALANGSFLIVQLVFLSIYFSVKHRKIINIFEGYFGWGDLLFLISITVYFSFLNYILFYLASLFAVVCFSLIFNALVKKPNPKIPLAGEQAVLFMLWFCTAKLTGHINLVSDAWIVNHLNL